METKIIMCDTNIFIHWFRNDMQTIDKLNFIGVENIVISSITKMELLQGTANNTELQAMNKKIKKYPILQVNETVSQLSIELIERFHLSHNLQIPDAIIAATAVVYKIPLFTYNTKDFRYIPHLELI